MVNDRRLERGPQSDVRDGITEEPLGHFVRNRMSTFNRIVRRDGHRGVLLRSGSHEK